MQRRQLLLASAGAASAALLPGCAALDTVSSEVSSFGQWPAGRAAGRYFIEQLPSQAAQAAQADQAGSGGLQTTMLRAAHQALQRAGFTAAPDLAQADVVVQIGVRLTVYDPSPWADPLWWRWGNRYWRGPGWAPWPRGGTVYWRQPPLPEREVAILLRDRATSAPLWESRAQSSGSATDVTVLEAMFTAALSDFPKAIPEAHRVTVQKAIAAPR